MSGLYVPGRPITGPGGKCPFCLKNKMFQGEIIAKLEHGYAGKIANDLVLICPTVHLVGEPWGTSFARQYFDLLQRTIEVTGWAGRYNDSRNSGDVSGQRLEHLHYKVQLRLPGQKSSGWGLDGLKKIVDEMQ